MKWFTSIRRLLPPRLAAVIMALMLIAGTGLTLAQTDTGHKIKVGDTVNGTLDAKTFAQTYIFDGKAGEIVTITATSKTAGLALALILSGPTGQPLNQAVEFQRAAVALTDIQLAADGTYQITVLRATGAQGTQRGDFTLALTAGAVAAAPTLVATATQPAAANPTTAPAATQASTPTDVQTVALDKGLSVTLSWASKDDFTVEVRDPIGGAANLKTPNIPSGGKHGGDINKDCATATDTNPSENVTWPSGIVPAGSYEIIVYYNNACPALAAGTTAQSVNFSVTVVVNGEALEPVRGALTPGQQYIASFVVLSADRVTVSPGGPNLTLDLTPFATKLGNPIAFGNRTSVSGTIDRNNAADVYSFVVGTGNPTVNISMNAQSGSLDTLLILLDANNAIIASNDDASDATRDSVISQPLPQGRYTIVATRFAAQIGGTEGNYTVSVQFGTVARASATPRGAVATTPPVAVAPTVTQGLPASNAGFPTGSIEVKLVWNTRADLRILVRDPAGRSVFSDNRTPDNSGILERLGNFKCTTTTNTPVTYAYWPNALPQTALVGTYEVGVWLQDRCTDTTILPEYTLTVSVRGKQVINITDRPDPNKAHLLTTFTVDRDGNAVAGPAGLVRDQFTSDISTQINSNPPVLQFATPVTGKIDSQAPFVVYTFEAKSGQRLAIVMRSTSGNLDTNLFLLNSNGIQVTSNDDSKPGEDTNSRIEARIDRDGTYVVVATRYGIELGGTQGNFELTVAQLNR